MDFNYNTELEKVAKSFPYMTVLGLVDVAEKFVEIAKFLQQMPTLKDTDYMQACLKDLAEKRTMLAELLIDRHLQ